MGCFYVSPDKNNKEVEMYSEQILKTFGTTFSNETSGKIVHTHNRYIRDETVKIISTTPPILGSQGQDSSLIMVKYSIKSKSSVEDP